MTNTEKQTRFRMKQELKKYKNQVFKECQLRAGFRRETPKEILDLLEGAASLPSGWNEDDFKRAWDRINQLRIDFWSKKNDLTEDVENGAGLTEAFYNNPEIFVKLRSDTKKSIFKTQALASHLISALELSALSNAEQAAAIMEAVRHVGRATAGSAEMANSAAMAICLASLPSHYDRPDWFLDSLTKWLANRLDDELIRELGKRLTAVQKEDML